MSNAEQDGADIVSLDGFSHGVQDVLPLGEELEQSVRAKAFADSHAQRRRVWAHEHELRLALWDQNEWEARMEAFKRVRAERRSS